MKITTKTLAILAFSALAACAVNENSSEFSNKAANRAACLKEGHKEETDAFIQCMMGKMEQQKGAAAEDMKKKLKAERDVREKLKEHERYRPFNF